MDTKKTIITIAVIAAIAIPTVIFAKKYFEPEGKDSKPNLLFQ